MKRKTGKTIKSILSDIDSVYRLTADRDSFREFQASGMRFHAAAYQAEGFGHVGVMTGTGMFGLVNMETLILNPFYVDAPIFSYDRIYMIRRNILVAEMYDSLSGSSFHTEALESIVRGCQNQAERKKHWYDPLVIPPGLRLKGKGGAAFDALSRRFLLAYLAASQQSDRCDPAEKCRKASVYTEGLLTHGGPATDPVKKAIGEAATADLFRRTLFGTGNPKGGASHG